MTTTDTGIGTAIREARKAKGLSAGALGTLLRPCVTHTAVYKWELGQTEPGISHMLQMRDILGLDLGRLFGDAGKKPSEIDVYMSRMSERQKQAVLAVASAMVESHPLPDAQGTPPGTGVAESVNKATGRDSEPSIS